MSKLFFSPIKVYQNPKLKRFKVYFTTEREISKRGNQNIKIVNPNFDVLPVLFDLCGVFVEKDQNGIVLKQVETPHLGVKSSFQGILRALMVLKALNPALYRLVVDVAKYLSYEVDDSYRIPPLALLFEEFDPRIEKAWNVVLDRAGISKEEYARTVINSFAEVGILDDFSLFHENKKKDEKAVEEFTQKRIAEFPYGLRTYTSWKEDLDLILSELRKEAERRKGSWTE